MSEAHVHVDPSNKKVALFIAVLALRARFRRDPGQGVANERLASHIEASNLWAFFQAKTIRQRRCAPRRGDGSPVRKPGARGGEEAVESWKKTVERYQSEPETNEGRKELMARAKEMEKKRDARWRPTTTTRCSAAVQIAIVLASAQIITGVAALLWIAYAWRGRRRVQPDRLLLADRGCTYSEFHVDGQEKRKRSLRSVSMAASRRNGLTPKISERCAGSIRACSGRSSVAVALGKRRQHDHAYRTVRKLPLPGDEHRAAATVGREPRIAGRFLRQPGCPPAGWDH